MKKITKFIIFTCFLLLLAGCKFQTVEQYEQMEKQQLSIEQQEQQPENEKLPEETEIKQPSTDAPKVEKEEKKEAEVVPVPKEDETPSEEVIKDKQPAPKKEQKPVVEKNEQAKTSEQPVKASPKKVEQQQLEKEAPKKVDPPQQKKRVVTITIQAKTLLKHRDLLDASLQSETYVPKDGVILKQTKYELLSEKDTVWDILQRAAREHKIQLEYQGANENMYNSVYIEGINHLYEFSAGPLSGWMYAVNGVYPNYGCSQYVLQDGDQIIWNYTVDLGRDLGQSASGS